MKLYEIAENYRVLMDMAEDPEVDEQALKDTADSIKEDFHDKADGIAKIIRTMTAWVDALDNEEKRIAERKRMIKSKIEWLKGYLESNMRTMGETKFKTSLFSFGIQKAGARPVEIDVDIADLPMGVLIYDIKPDKKKIGEYLKNDPETWSKYAHFGEQKEGLRIR